MGEYARLNNLLRQLEAEKKYLEDNGGDPERIADYYQAIGEVKGDLLEMAEMDGFEDPYEAFDY